MNKTLAQKLKRFGFPQDGEGEIYYGGSVEDGTYWEVLSPTLSKLIEVCGDKIKQIERHDNGTWEAVAFLEPTSPNRYVDTKIGRGSTIEEAVANLWIELNKQVET